MLTEFGGKSPEICAIKLLNIKNHENQNILFFLLALLPALGKSQLTSLHTSIEQVKQALKKRDYSLLQPLLAADVKIGDFPRGKNDLVVPQILQQLPAIDSILITSLTKQGNDTLVLLDFIRNNKHSDNQLVFNQQGKITELGILGGVRALSSKQVNRKTILPEEVILPFRVSKGIIVVDAEINGIKGKFLFDSGAPDLILNSKDNLTQTANKLKGVNGEIKNSGSTKIDSFCLSGIKIMGGDIYTMDLSHLEKKLGLKFLGIIGYEVYKEYELRFNYFKKELHLLKTDSAGTCIRTVAIPERLVGSSNFKLIQHIPVVESRIGNTTYKMGIDCGAAGNLLDEKYLETLIPYCKRVKNGALIGAENKSNKVKVAKIKRSIIGGANFKNTRTTFSNSSLDQFNQGFGLGIDGLIGYPTLKQYISCINYKQKKISFYSGK